ncbi:hypothetical protein [Leptospira johnsonii]|uniref:Uncharacterized protein n=1 Tax=Leptospira johnsonii TaxID=1917820 RepID=A0A2P2CXT6_9LEPT|nr:hypothetical protein [Leptospira johnsonii]GBF37156.1 hypothetical protein LPTSP1_01340 [Leptospira johnsonii]
MRPSFYAYQDFKYLDPCNGEALEFSEQLTIEEIPELKNGIWLPGLDLVLHSKNGFDPLLNPFPSPHQLEKQIFRPKTRTYITVNAKEFLKGHEIISAELCFGSYFSHRYLKIQASGGEVINLSSAGGPFEIFMTDSGRPSPIPKNISLNKCEILGISKFSLPKGERILAFQSEYSSGISKIWKTESRVFRLKGHIEDLPEGILFIARPDDLRKKDDRLSVWSAYPILYPFSIGLDIVTSPLQLISIIVFGYENHLYLWGCLLAGKCRIPLG